MENIKPTFTHFGNQTVTPEEKTQKVAAVFDNVSQRYDLMNDLMSFGLHRMWKMLAVQLSFIRPGAVILDCAGGTGDLSQRLLTQTGKTGRVILSDINSNMLKIGRDKLIDAGFARNIDYVLADAQCLPFDDNSFDVITISFGLRNVTHIPRALNSMQRILKPGGVLIVLEFSEVQLPIFKKIYDLYSFNVLPKLGKWILDDKASYQYLAESIRKHPNQESLKQLLLEQGFDKVNYFNFSGGIVALHKAYKF